ncbi:arsenate-mycothiol transferase ArsC [Tenacibaculum jejuense]|uniref:Low molecular weight phosphatase family protein n=1 Tax=Tenacibaculum jejuense TaxID=584609 RepID=A0A238U9Q6_9FLAO|nr:protein-tyrosine-phosphatase [Tenacibaculum jejuense]SNR15194.1 Low molecular weight phosphatase family protein [Tenacibaculum jejuense]
MNKALIKTIENIASLSVDKKRQEVLYPLVDYIKEKRTKNEDININFICTHNSRRSHLGQIWMQTLANYFNIKNIKTYSGGTEATALANPIAETLKNQGFDINIIGENTNPVYAIKYDEVSHPIIGFSKRYDDSFNPSSKFAAIMTCSQADEGCPFIAGTDKRIAITYEDPKISDHTDKQAQTYLERSNQIASEMYFVLSQLN